MKSNKILYLVFFLINIAVLLVSYLYPITRDEFYYLNHGTFVNPFKEYCSSYFDANGRIGQFFSNLVSRNVFFEIIFALLLFNSFFIAIFTNVFKRLPSYRNGNDVSKLLIFTAIFIFLINYFGEMFFYTPFSGNYTLVNIFYLFFVFLFIEYYVFEKSNTIEKINYFYLILLGVFIGMGNEHIPPILLLMSFLGGLQFLVRKRKWPHPKFVILAFSIFIGYLILFFAPANRLKEQSHGQKVLDISLHSYFENFVGIFKMFYYYNLSMILVFILVFILGCIFRKKIQLSGKEIAVYVLFAFFPLFIVAVSPLQGTRLLFFSCSIMIIIILLIVTKFTMVVNFHRILSIPAVIFLLSYFGIAILITYNARQDYNGVTHEIEAQKIYNSNITLHKSFDYFTPIFGRFNRRVLLDRGTDYIDQNPKEDNIVERNLKRYYQIISLKIE